MPKNIRPPVGGGERVRERWEQDVSYKLDNTDYSIDDLSRVIFLANRTTSGQQSELDIEHYLRTIYNKLNARDMELERVVEENRRLSAQFYGLKARLEDTNRQLEEIRRLTWL